MKRQNFTATVAKTLDRSLSGKKLRKRDLDVLHLCNAAPSLLAFAEEMLLYFKSLGDGHPHREHAEAVIAKAKGRHES